MPDQLIIARSYERFVYWAQDHGFTNRAGVYGNSSGERAIYATERNVRGLRWEDLYIIQIDPDDVCHFLETSTYQMVMGLRRARAREDHRLMLLEAEQLECEAEVAKAGFIAILDELAHV